MRARRSELFRLIGSQRLAGLIVVGALLSYAAISADGPQDALVIEKDGAVRVNTALYGKGAVPVGAILMWSGEPAKLPAGWVLCDGNNNTPDLRGRFIVGYASNPTSEMTQLGYNEMKKPGGTNHNTITLKDLGDHTHTIAVSELRAVSNHTHRIGNHKHRYTVSQTWDTSDSGSGETSRADAAVQGLAVANATTSNVVANPAATKSLDNRPPYMVLAYVMYIGK